MDGLWSVEAAWCRSPERAQALLAANTQGVRSGPRDRNPGQLAGLITDASGTALIATHATTHKRRYRYNASKADDGEATLRIQAREIKGAVFERLATLLDDALALLPRHS